MFSGDVEAVSSFLWILVTPVIPADGWDDGGDENDGGDRIAAFFDPDRRAGLSRNKPGNDTPPHVILAVGGNPEERRAQSCCYYCCS